MAEFGGDNCKCSYLCNIFFLLAGQRFGVLGIVGSHDGCWPQFGFI
jgi:hypothetical protein